MQLTIQAKGENVKAISYLLSKNPNNLYERRVKDHLVRLVYHELSETSLAVTIFVTPNALALVQNDNALDITHYINDREFAASSIFLSLIRSALGTALNGKPKEQYLEWVAQTFSFSFEVGPVASAMTNDEINGLFEPLGYAVTIEAMNNHNRARFLTLSADITLQRALQHLFVLIPVLDDYKHYFIDELEVDKLKRYGGGWLDTHPMKEYIYKKPFAFPIYMMVLLRYKIQHVHSIHYATKKLLKRLKIYLENQLLLILVLVKESFQVYLPTLKELTSCLRLNLVKLP
ncbi:hypothetical protein [Lysinibacillus xylanilyticus]|uniref:hypothetical protein n=1 Tax=Lysinibacillus xylanilyticus TaxID=582475 RepID=UPI000AFD27A0|nr:hypothetical protein [Lysinibacillus xylanilyticus]